MELKRIFNKRFFAALAFGTVFAASMSALKVPVLSARVNDYANIIDSQTENELENYLYNLEEQSGVQIAVLTVESLEGDEISSFSFRVADEWKIGSEKNDDGAILVVALKEHDLKIEVGDGLEHLLTDAKCGLIIRNIIIPEFREGNYSRGILNGVKNMGGVASENMEIVSNSVQNGEEEDFDFEFFISIFVWIIFFAFVISSRTGLLGWLLFSRTGRFSNYRHYTNIKSSSGSFKNYSGGFGNFGGGSSFHSGGFHGGGGHFSGGGASGHW